MIPGPTIRIAAGDLLQINLINNLLDVDNKDKGMYEIIDNALENLV
jgi:hypothetical protein